MTAGPAQSALLRALDAPRAAREPAWLESLRAEAAAAFRANGLPTTRDEDWRFTPLAKLEKFDFAPASPARAKAAAGDRLDAAHRLVFANGRFDPAASNVGELPAGCLVAPLAGNLEAARESLGACGDAKRRPFEALNTALFSDGALVSLAPGARIERPIHLVFQSHSGTAHVRTSLRAGAGSHAVVIEQHVGGEAPALVNAVTELSLARGASLQHVLLQGLPGSSFGFFALLSRQEASSRLALQSIALGGSLARVETESRLEGELAELELDGLYLARESQIQDHHTSIDHAAPRTTSRELFKGILDGRAHGVFHGRIHVRPLAQKIDASQTNRTLLLSDGAVIDTKPQLEIYADDVKCSHGASIGQLDPDQIFYLRARGLELARARALLTYAFGSEVLEKLPIPALRESLERELLGWLGSET